MPSTVLAPARHRRRDRPRRDPGVRRPGDASKTSPLDAHRELLDGHDGQLAARVRHPELLELLRQRPELGRSSGRSRSACRSATASACARVACTRASTSRRVPARRSRRSPTASCAIATELGRRLRRERHHRPPDRRSARLEPLRAHAVRLAPGLGRTARHGRHDHRSDGQHRTLVRRPHALRDPDERHHADRPDPVAASSTPEADADSAARLCSGILF